MVREGRVFISPTGDPEYGVDYYVTAYEVGAQVVSVADTTVTVRAGHGFAATDKFIVGTDVTTYRTVQSVTSTTLEIDSPISLAEGDLLVNLAADTGPTQPYYDGKGLTIYTDMDYSNVAVNNTVRTDSYGRYRYFHKGIARWELVRGTNGTPVAIYTDANQPDELDEVRYAHLFATSGTGTLADPWVTSGCIAIRKDCREDEGG